jgi:hypothetical protein
MELKQPKRMHPYFCLELSKDTPEHKLSKDTPPEHNPKHPDSVDLITTRQKTKQNYLYFIDRCENLKRKCIN